jgi:alpha 1,2-mannosyltransferase
LGNRWGDAPVHALAVAMMLNSSEVHFFNDIGYKHNPLMHCPIEPYLQKNCWCDEKQNFGNKHSLVYSFDMFTNTLI